MPAFAWEENWLDRFSLVLAEREASSLHAPVALTDPVARAHRTVGDRAPDFASQRGAALALVDRLNRHSVAHTGEDTPHERGSP